MPAAPSLITQMSAEAAAVAGPLLGVLCGIGRDLLHVFRKDGAAPGTRHRISFVENTPFSRNNLAQFSCVVMGWLLLLHSTEKVSRLSLSTNQTKTKRIRTAWPER